MSARPAEPAMVVHDPVIVHWAGEGDGPARRRVEVAVAAGVRRAFGTRGAAHLDRPHSGGPVADGVSWGADADGTWWTMPAYDSAGAPVAVPIRRAAGTAQGENRLPFGDVVSRSAFPPLPVVRLAVDEWIKTGSDPYVSSSSLARALQWGRALYGAHGFTVLERIGSHAANRFVMVPLAEQLLVGQFGRSAPAKADTVVEAAPGLQRSERGQVLPLTDFRVVLIATGDRHFGFDLGLAAHWTPGAVKRELARTPPGERLDPGVAARVASARLTAEGTGAEPGPLDEDVMLKHIVTMDREIFSVMSWEQRADFLTILSGLLWPSAREKKAMIELIAAAHSTNELEATAAILRKKDAYRRLFTTLDGSVVELLLILGRTRPPGPMTPRFIIALFRELYLLPEPGQNPQDPDPLRQLRTTANGLSLWVRSTVESFVELFTRSPAELIEGIAHLTEFAIVVHRATTAPPDPKAMETLQVLGEQAGPAIRTAMAGLEYAEELGTPYGHRGGGARITGELSQTLATALAVEILSWFIGLGEIKEALSSVKLTERITSLLKVLASVRRLGGAAETAKEISRLERLVAALTKLAMLKDEAAAAHALRLLPQGYLAELVRLADLIDVPAGARAKVLRDLARSKNAEAEVQRLADALSLARRFDRRAEALGGVTEDMMAALRRLLDTGWDRRRLRELVEAIPEERLAEWSRALKALRPDQVQRLGTDSLAALSYWPRSMTFVAEAGGDVYLTMLQRHSGELRVVDNLLYALELRKTEIGDAAAYQRLIDRLVKGEEAAGRELSSRLSQAAQEALARLRAGDHPHLMAELKEFEDLAARLREQGRTVEAATEIARRDGLAAEIGKLSERELSGLEHLARISDDTGGFDWAGVLDLAAGDRADLLSLVNDVAGRLPDRNLSGVENVLRNMLERRVGKQGQVEKTVQGSWGELYAARTLIEDGATALEFQEPLPNRVVDIIAELPGRGRVSVEVKTNLAGKASFVEAQVVKDLTAHAGTGYADLLYLYHWNVGREELQDVGRQMLALFDKPELTSALAAAGHDPAKARAAFEVWLEVGNPQAYRRSSR